MSALSGAVADYGEAVDEFKSLALHYAASELNSDAPRQRD